MTAGPTVEQIDPVRFIGNHSSGLMGFSLANEAFNQGGEVTLITGPVTEKNLHAAIHRIDVTSAAEMLQACEQQINDTDILIMAAAVADYTPTHPTSGKIKKSSEDLCLNLSPTKDILRELGAKKREEQCFVGFALETDNELENARKKLEEKSLDIIVLNSLNDQGAGFGNKTNKVTLLTKNGQTINGTLKSKKEVASDILSAISEYLKSN